MPRPARYNTTLTHVARERAKASDQVTHLANSDVPYARPRKIDAQYITDSSWSGPVRLTAGTPAWTMYSGIDWWEGTEAYLYVWLAVMAMVDMNEGTETLTVTVDVCNLTDDEVLQQTWTCANSDLVASLATAGVETTDVLLSSGAQMKLALSGNAALIPSMGIDPGVPLFIKCTLTANNLDTTEELHLTAPTFLIVSAYPTR